MPSKKRKSPEQQIKCLCEKIRERISHWKDICENGCNDPSWADGCNMNLVRNHIIYYKHQIIKLCDENNLSYPEDIYLQTPPQVNDNYMANLKEKGVYRELGWRISHKGKSSMTKTNYRYFEQGKLI